MDGVNEDDLLEIKQDISSLRFELRDDRRKGKSLYRSGVLPVLTHPIDKSNCRNCSLLVTH